MVDLMLKGFGEQAPGFKLIRFSGAVLCPNLDLYRALHDLGVLGEAEAAFFVGHRAFPGKDLGVDQDQKRMPPGLLLFDSCQVRSRWRVLAI